MDMQENEKFNKNQTINFQSQRQFIEQGSTRISEKQTMRFEINRLFSDENKQMYDGQDHPSINGFNVPDIMNEMNDMKVENYIVSPKSIDRILVDSNYNGKSYETQNRLRPTTQQFQPDQQTSFSQLQQQNNDFNNSHSNFNEKLKMNADQFHGDRSSFIKNQSYNLSLLDHKQEVSYNGIFEANDKFKSKNTNNNNTHIEPIPKGIEFLVIKNVKKFIVKMKKQSRSILFKQLSKPQFNIINDISSSFDYYLDNGFFNLKVISQYIYQIIINSVHSNYLLYFLQQSLKHLLKLFCISQEVILISSYLIY